METAPPLSQTADLARRLYAERFGAPPRWVVAAPGRVNLIGEHTDYNDGFVMPMAIDRYVVLAAGPGDAGDGPAGSVPFRVFSQLTGEERVVPVGLARKEDLPAWCVYPWGVLDLMRQRGYDPGPLRATLLSTVPLGGGLSSSAALEVATATLVEAAAGRPLDGREKARLCQRAENEYVGMPCGIMDQFSSALCREGEAMRLDCRSLETFPAPLADPSVAVVIVNSNVKHELTGSEYPTRRAQCEQAARDLGVPALRDATPEALERARPSMDEVVYRRARHIVTENARVLAFADALSQGDFASAGRLMHQSHASMRDDFEISCPEIDVLVELAMGLVAEGGVFGSRMTGGGFGGCTVSLVRTDRVGAFAEAVARGYQARTGIEPTVFSAAPSRGAHVLSEEGP